MGDSCVLACSAEAAAVGAVHEAGDEAGVIGLNLGEEDKGTGGDDEGGDRTNCGGNRWPRQETLALLQIRSDMDAVFRDSSLKGPLWEEIARKLAELGYNRSAKKCKEKFENVYKYHKRTKEGRTGKQDGKTYRFFDQLQALEKQPSAPQPKPQASGAVTSALPWINSTPSVSQITVPFTINPIIVPQDASAPVSEPTIPPIAAKIPAIPSVQTNNPRHLSLSAVSANLFSSTSTSSSTASDQELKGRYRRKRKWKVFFQRIAKEVIEKQEKLQQKFLETIEKQENERMVREEAWRMQEISRINREHEILVQERSTAAAKDAAIIAFLQRLSGQHHPTQAHANSATPLSLPMPRPPAPIPLPVPLTNSDIQKMDSFENSTPRSSSRWPKAEVQALIKLRTSLDLKYQETGPKGPLWEDISAGMRRLGYTRSAKRCKEKWENINKYFKKVKDSNTRRHEDSKTCPYFHQLDALYKVKNKTDSSVSPRDCVKPSDLMEPLMVQPERQWPPQEDNQPETAVGDIDDRDNVEQNQEVDKDAESEEDDDGVRYEMVINKPSSIENLE